MLKHCLPLLLIVLIALQSVAALAGGHLVCEDDNEHSTLTINDISSSALDPTNNPLSLPVDNENCQDAAQDADDCHTCGHCHGHFSSALLSQFADLTLIKHSSLPCAYLANSPPSVITRFLRPPIA